MRGFERLGVILSLKKKKKKEVLLRLLVFILHFPKGITDGLLNIIIFY